MLNRLVALYLSSANGSFGRLYRRVRKTGKDIVVLRLFGMGQMQTFYGLR
jgi:hypothetical protein